ncbi:MAG: TIM barrel protein [Bacteroidetes bacterium]|nr:TIM barrel protein [Bacteroidota bacterium]
MKYHFPIGITTNSFSSSIQSEEIKYTKILQWASTHGFNWVEIRDSKSDFKYDAVKELNTLAVNLGIEAHLAWDNTDLGSEFSLDKWKQQMEKASIFEGPRFSRVTISPSAVDWDNSGYCISDFKQILSNTQTILELAEENDLRLVFENSFETLVPEGDYFGIDEFMSKVEQAELCLDYSNLLNKEQVSQRPCL